MVIFEVETEILIRVTQKINCTSSCAVMVATRLSWSDRNGIAVLPTFHPIAVVQNAQLKAPVWEDLKKVIRRLAT